MGDHDSWSSPWFEDNSTTLYWSCREAYNPIKAVQANPCHLIEDVPSCSNLVRFHVLSHVGNLPLWLWLQGESLGWPLWHFPHSEQKLRLIKVARLWGTYRLSVALKFCPFNPTGSIKHSSDGVLICIPSITLKSKNNLSTRFASMKSWGHENLSHSTWSYRSSYIQIFSDYFSQLVLIYTVNKAKGFPNSLFSSIRGGKLISLRK